jgi:hypothetical protein
MTVSKPREPLTSFKNKDNRNVPVGTSEGPLACERV